MRKRNMLAVAILIIGTAASFYCYSRISQLLPMSVAADVTHAQARITEVTTPMVKKGETVSEVRSDVLFAFEVNGKTVEGAYSIKGRDKAPVKGASEAVVYLTRQPAVFLRESDYADLPRQLKALRMMMMVFALAAIILPFGVMHHR